jgi:hypothetical protein
MRLNWNVSIETVGAAAAGVERKNPYQHRYPGDH